MIGYTTLGTNDLPKAAAFYDELLGTLGAKRLVDIGRLMMWGKEFGQPMLSVCVPYDEKDATVGNGVMIALLLESHEEIDKFHAKALEMGATNDGDPGPRGDTGGFYGGYFRDLDGNKICAAMFG